MDSSKDVMQLFIAEYNALFAQEGEPAPRVFWEKLNKKKSPPPRPPPPKVQSLPSFSTPCAETITASLTSSASSTALDYRPVPSPRKIKTFYDSSSGSEFEGRHTPTFSLHSSIPVFSPRDFDPTRSHSPFALESETHSAMESPMITARTQEFVEKTIGETISEHIFGTMDFNENSGSQSPRTKTDESDDNGNLEDLPVSKSILSPPGIMDKRRQTAVRSRTSHMLDDTSQENNQQDFDGLERSNILTAHKKPIGPPRRSPSRKHRRSWEADHSSEGTLPFSHTQLDPPSNNVIQAHNLNRSLNHSQGGGDKENEAYEEDRQGTGDASPTIKPKSMRRTENKALLPRSLSLQNTQESFPSQPSPTSNGSGPLDRSPSNGIKLFIPPLDLTTLHEHIDGVEPIPLSKERLHTQIWVKTSLLPHDNNVPIISPRSNKLKNWSESDPPLTVVYEAPMSPSAYCSSGLFRVSMNTDIPPSPPIQQDLYKKHSDDDGSYRLRQITKKIQGLKKKIKVFEENFEKEYGYRPTQGEKAGQPDIKRYMNELSKARKDLKRLKEETEKGNRSRHNSGASCSGADQAPPVLPTVSTTLDYIQKCLSDKRQESGRPEPVVLMSRDQVQEEKLAVQRALLHFEGIHGRPTTKEEKDIMRPLYDRYRAIKRMLAKPMSPRNSLELQTVPEDQMMEIPQTFNRHPIHVRVPTGYTEDEEIGTPDPGTLEFGLVTRDYNVMRDFELPSFHGGATDKGLQQAGGGGVEADANLHQLSLSELHVQIEDSKKVKKRLRRILREFEESFLLKSGRKVQKEDRYPLQTEYSDYKKVKARLRLLEALVLKQHE
ncbi:unnamed protein product [Lymnaea stagnalis]|uniref:FAM13A-like domain-containing protein n=1 Tax=Lymnaea stagnalis TaxID=6523 RepID=A0AAV2IDA8_LYMST